MKPLGCLRQRQWESSWQAVRQGTNSVWEEDFSMMQISLEQYGANHKDGVIDTNKWNSIFPEVPQYFRQLNTLP